MGRHFKWLVATCSIIVIGVVLRLCLLVPLHASLHLYNIQLKMRQLMFCLDQRNQCWVAAWSWVGVAVTKSKEAAYVLLSFQSEFLWYLVCCSARANWLLAVGVHWFKNSRVDSELVDECCRLYTEHKERSQWISDLSPAHVAPQLVGFVFVAALGQ